MPRPCKVLRMKAMRNEATVLQRDLDSAQRAFESVSARLTQSGLESQSTQSNVNVLSQAVPPVKPSSPNILLNALLSIVVGLVLGVGIVLLLELRDRRVRGVDDVIDALKLPILGVMPKPDTRRGGSQRLLRMEQRVLGNHVAPTKRAA